MKKLKAALLGAGNRGQVYCDYSLYCPQELEIVAVIDVNPFKMNEAGDKYSVPASARYTNLDTFLADKVECDFIVNATMDEMHYETAMKTLNAGYNLILEKPVTGKKEELLEIAKTAEEKGLKVLVCHVLRYTPFCRVIKEILKSGKLGRVMNMYLNEHVWYGHFINAYVRGKWRSEEACGSGFLLAKCCHDTDLLCWLNNDTQPVKVSSFGSRSFFTEENAPEGATQYCYECPHKDSCMFDAHRLQIEQDFIPFYTWAGLNKPLDEITLEEKEEFLKKDAYGQCVYKVQGMDIVDKQCVTVEFANGTLATLNMVGGTSKAGRFIHLVCEYGEILGYIVEDKLIVREFDLRKKDGTSDRWYDEKVIDISKEVDTGGGAGNAIAGHHGGDYFLMHDAIRYFNGVSESVSVTKIEDSLNGHFVCYAAEVSRKEGRIVTLDEIKNS